MRSVKPTAAISPPTAKNKRGVSATSHGTVTLQLKQQRLIAAAVTDLVCDEVVALEEEVVSVEDDVVL